MAKLRKEIIETWYYINKQDADNGEVSESVGYSLAINGIIQKITGRITEFISSESYFRDEKKEMEEAINDKTV